MSLKIPRLAGVLSLEIRDERIRNGWSVGRSICGDENNDDDVSGLCSGGVIWVEWRHAASAPDFIPNE